MFANKFNFVSIICYSARQDPPFGGQKGMVHIEDFMHGYVYIATSCLEMCRLLHSHKMRTAGTLS